jgi:hypothetical protein
MNFGQSTNSPRDMLVKEYILSKQALDIEEGKIYFAKEGVSSEESFEVMFIF